MSPLIDSDSVTSVSKVDGLRSTAEQTNDTNSFARAFTAVSKENGEKTSTNPQHTPTEPENAVAEDDHQPLFLADSAKPILEVTEKPGFGVNLHAPVRDLLQNSEYLNQLTNSVSKNNANVLAREAEPQGTMLPLSGKELPLIAGNKIEGSASGKLPQSSMQSGAIESASQPVTQHEIEFARANAMYEKDSFDSFSGKQTSEPANLLSGITQRDTSTPTFSSLLTNSFAASESPQPLTGSSNSGAVVSALESSAKPHNLAELAVNTDTGNSSKPEQAIRDQLLTPYSSQRWHADFAGRVRFLAQANSPTVELNLHPAELGSIEIKIQAMDDGTIVNFFSSNPVTRELIDQNLSRLRDLLSDSGIQLQHTDVSDKQSRSEDSHAHEQNWNQIEFAGEMPQPQLLQSISSAPRSMVDHYV